MTNKTTDEKTQTTEQPQLTIAGCLEVILNAKRGSAENDLPFSESSQAQNEGEDAPIIPIDEAYDFVCSTLEISRTQAELLGAIIECSGSGSASADQVSRFLGCSNLHFLSLQDDIDSLIEKRYLRVQKSGSARGWMVPASAMKSIRKNSKPCGDGISNLTASSFFRKMNSLFRDFYRERIDRKSLEMEIFDLIRYNPQIPFVSQWESFGIEEDSRCEQILLLFAVTRTIMFNEESWGVEDFGKLYADEEDELFFDIDLEIGNLSLFKKGLLEHVNNDGIVDNSRVTLTDKAMRTLLAGLVSKGSPKSSPNLVNSSNLDEKKLFYNEAEGRQIETISKLLDDDNYNKTIERLKEKKMRGCITILFAGGPGTGKTESVYQLARKSGRNIYVVNVSELKSKWVGDSEKNVKAVFEEYRTLVKESDKAPVLLFNEADAVFGVRKKGAVDSVDKMNNTIQNILLQELENLEGICIATTNITENLDSAFERRFLFKVQFSKPGKEVMKNIWCSMVEDMDEKDAETLSNEYQFTGGQIENVSRQMIISYVISGDKPSMSKIKEFCDNENILASSTKPRPRIGF